MAIIAGGRARAQRSDISSTDSSQETLSSLEDSEEDTLQTSDDHGGTLRKEDRLSTSCSSLTSDARSSTPSSAAHAVDDSSSEQQQQHAAATRAGTTKNDGCRGRANTGRRSQLPLRQVVARRAFKCVVGAQGGLSKVLDIGGYRKSKQPVQYDCQVESDEVMKQHEQSISDGGPQSSEVSVEPVPYGADIDVGGKDLSEGFWGVDLHMCDLGSLVGLPAEQGGSPWASDANRNDSGEQHSWRCVFLDASLNRLRGITAIADQPCLRDLAYLDVSHNLIGDLESVQDLPNLQVLLASNNQIDSVQALGERRRAEVRSSSSSSSSSSPPPSSVRHADLSYNSIVVVEAPLSARAFRHIRSLRLASNRLQYVEEDAAHSLTSLERLDVSDNELVSIDWVAFLESLRFLDCSENRISALPAFARALATPPRLEEAIAEGNPVVKEPQYRITVLTKCKKMLRLDHRPVDGAVLKRQLDLATQTKALDGVRETACDEYHRSVEGERSRLEKRKEILRAQERQLDEAFQGYRLQKQREMGECVAYAESLRGDDGRGPLTPRVAHDFREAVGENRRPPNEVENNNSSACNITTNRSRNRDDADGGFRKDHPSATDERSTSLKAALSAAVDRKIPESTRSAGDSDGSEDGSEDDGEDDHGDRSHASGDEGTSSGSDVGTGGSRQNDPQRGNASVSGGTRRGGRRREVSARVGAQRDDKGAKGGGGGGGGDGGCDSDSRRGKQRGHQQQMKADRSITNGGGWGDDESDSSAVISTHDLPTKKSGGGGLFKTLGWRRGGR